jgi:transcriptional regulator with XRE-family HTH domain
MNHPLVAHRVRTLRREQGFTQEELAHDAGVAISTVQRVERGRHQPSPRVVHAIANALDVSPRDLFQETSQRGATPLRAAVGGHVTLIASPRNGTGRSLLAITLAGLFLHHGYRVLLMDFDDIRGVGWFVTWAHELGVPAPDHTREDTARAAAERLPGLRQLYDHVIVDSSSIHAEDLLPLALRADQLLLTTQHPHVDFRSPREHLDLWLDMAHVHRVDLRILPMRASRYPSDRREGRRFLDRVGLPALGTDVCQRSAYDRLLYQGRTVAQDDALGPAAREIYAVVNELGWPLAARTTFAARDRTWNAEDVRHRDAWHHHRNAVHALGTRGRLTALRRYAMAAADAAAARGLRPSAFVQSLLSP